MGRAVRGTTLWWLAIGAIGPRIARGQDTMMTAPHSMIEGSFSLNGISRKYKLFVPSGATGGRRALVVMLHGCTQDASDFARGTRMNEAAQARGWVVLYPEQPASAQPAKCWSWYDPAHQRRGAGEPALIAELTQKIASDVDVDRTRIYLAGGSAGAVMATNVLAAYPELFAAAVLHSGLPYAAASSVTDAVAAMKQGVPDVRVNAQAASDAMGERRRPIPVLIIHGLADAVVAPVNGQQLAEQWARTNAVARGETFVLRIDHRVAPDGTWTVDRYTDDAGMELAELRRVPALGHAWSGGSRAGTYTDERPPHATDWAVEFFDKHTQGR